MAANDYVRESVAQALALGIATDVKALAVLINGNDPDLDALITTDKTNLVAAINEAATTGGGGGTDGVVDGGFADSTYVITIDGGDADTIF